MIILHKDQESETVLATVDMNEENYADIKRLFGTTTLPTAYTSLSSRETVLQAIRKLNPTSIVKWEEKGE